MPRFSTLPPLAKLASWLLLTLLIAGVVQLAATGLGFEFHILTNQSGARGLLLASAVIALLTVMAADQRPVGDYGIIVGPAWKKLFFGGFAAGGGVFALYLATAWAAGVYELAPSVSTSRVLKALAKAGTAIPVSVTQQLLFSGYLLTMLRDRYRPSVAILATAFLFAVLGRLGDPQALATVEVWPVLVGLFLTATLLGFLRLNTGSILVPTGVLAGWLFGQRLLNKSGILLPVPSPLTDWLAPANDPRQAPLMWIGLAVAIAASCYVLWRYGEQKVKLDGSAIDADFKRVFPLSNAMALAPLDVWLPQLWRAGFRIGGAYLPRLAAVLVFSTVNTLLSLPERLLLRVLTANRKVDPPVFIVGAHRSGTTHLHNLLSLDPQLVTTRTYHILNPTGCVFSGWLITPILGLFLPYKRPMDAVRFHLFTPQEEEFAISGSSGQSPYWGTTFPRMWPYYERYMFPGELPPAQLASWKRQYLFFLRKLTFWTRKRPLLKNPYNTGRVALLAEMFPEAKFIHIHRHPETVYRSNMHLAREAHVMNQLQDPDPQTSYQRRFLANYQAMEEAYVAAAETLPAGRCGEVAFERLEIDAIAEVQRLYAELGLEFTDAFRERLESYLAGLGDYRKNRYHALSEQQRRLIDSHMGPLMERWGYPRIASEDRSDRSRPQAA